MALPPWERPVWHRSKEWWDRVYRVLNMAMRDGHPLPYIEGDGCVQCGSQFPAHRCHMEEGR